MTEDAKDIEDNAKDLEDLMASKGVHEGHTLKQIGRCIYCSCGQRIQGRVPERKRLEVVLPDAFVCWRGYDRLKAEEIASKHDGAIIRQE